MSSIHKFHICDFIFGPLSAVTYFCFPGYSHSAFSICGFSPLSTRNILAVKNSQCKMKKGKELGFRNFALGSQGRPVPAAQPEGRDRWGPFVSGPREVEHRSAFPLLASAPHAQQCAPVLSSVFLPVPQFFTDPLATSAICDSSLLGFVLWFQVLDLSSETSCLIQLCVEGREGKWSWTLHLTYCKICSRYSIICKVTAKKSKTKPSRLKQDNLISL